MAGASERTGALDRRPIRSLARLAHHLHGLIETRLWVKVLLGMVLGIATGLALGPSAGWVARDVARVASAWLALPGQLFLGVIQMIAVPLVFSSIIRGLAASEDTRELRRLGVRLGGYFVATTTLAVMIGFAMAYLIRPGDHVDSDRLVALMEQQPAAATAATTATAPGAPDASGAPDAPEPGTVSVPDLVESLLPINPLGAMVEGQMLQIVLFSIVVGIALLAMAPGQSRPMIDLLGSLQGVCMTVVGWAMRLAPVAVFGLLARVTMTLGLGALVGLAVYVATVLAGLATLIGVYLILVRTVGRRSPRAFLRGARDVQLLAFSTSSSAAVMPVSLETAGKLGVRSSISQFIIPLGATINMDGTALYQAVATVFLAQVLDLHLGVAGLALIVATTVGASIGSPSTPGVGIVLLASVLRTAGIPAEAVVLVIGVDRILDMSRTAVNVTGDLTACVVMDRWLPAGEPAVSPADP